jgi:hypothetical protein
VGRLAGSVPRAVLIRQLTVVYLKTGLSYLLRFFPSVLPLIFEVKIYDIDRIE